MNEERQRRIRIVWSDLPYGHHGSCCRCGRSRDGDGDERPLYVRGRSPSLCVCIECFTAAGGRAPRRRLIQPVLPGAIGGVA